MDKKKVLLLVGSPKKEHSTSNCIGQYLLNNLKKSDYLDKTVYIYDLLKNEANSKEMIKYFNESDVIILSYPLYVDSLPASCIEMLEYITKERQEVNCNKKQIFLAIGNCGFYENEQIQNSLNVCRFFAKDNGLKWYGGISVGGGPQLQGKDLVSLGGMTKKLRQALDIISGCILQGHTIPINKINMMTNPPEPKFIYFSLANLGFKYESKRNGVLKNINDRPYKLEKN